MESERKILKNNALGSNTVLEISEKCGKSPMACTTVTKVMQAHVLDPGLPAHQVPEQQVGAHGPPRIERRGKDPGAPGSRLPLQDGAGRRIQEDLSRPGLGVGEVERVSVHVLTAQGDDLALAAAGQQEKADDFRLPRTRCQRAGMAVRRGISM